MKFPLSNLKRNSFKLECDDLEARLKLEDFRAKT
jgi:hypothetical protein